MPGFQGRWIVGKTVAQVEMRPFKARKHSFEAAHNPVILFTDGSTLEVHTEETDWGFYGADFIYTPAKRRK